MYSADGVILEITWRRAFVVWWSFFWRSVVFTAMLGGVLGFIDGIGVAVRGRPDLGAVVGSILGRLGAIPISLVVLRLILRKEFKEFSICLVANRETTRSTIALNEGKPNYGMQADAQKPHAADT